jgi:hypothetical protein
MAFFQQIDSDFNIFEVNLHVAFQVAGLVSDTDYAKVWESYPSADFGTQAISDCVDGFSYV